MKSRLISELKKAVVVLFIGALHFLMFFFVGISVPCIFHAFTGLLCPACGVTRMILSVLKLDFSSAYGYNRALFFTLPLICIVVLTEEIRYIVSGQRKMLAVSRVFLWLEIVLLVLFGIVRNII